MANREREIQLKFRVTPEERELIEAKMAQLGTQNMAAYLRKMALDGYVVRLELPELREMVSLLRRSSNNLTSLPGASMRRDASMMPTWKICGRDRKSCGRRRNISSRHWRP